MTHEHVDQTSTRGDEVKTMLLYDLSKTWGYDKALDMFLTYGRGSESRQINIDHLNFLIKCAIDEITDYATNEPYEISVDIKSLSTLFRKICQLLVVSADGKNSNDLEDKYWLAISSCAQLVPQYYRSGKFTNDPAPKMPVTLLSDALREFGCLYPLMNNVNATGMLFVCLYLIVLRLDSSNPIEQWRLY